MDKIITLDREKSIWWVANLVATRHGTPVPFPQFTLELEQHYPCLQVDDDTLFAAIRILLATGLEGNWVKNKPPALATRVFEMTPGYLGLFQVYGFMWDNWAEKYRA